MYMMNCEAMNQIRMPKNDLKIAPPPRCRGLPFALGAVVSGGRSRDSQLPFGAGEVAGGVVGFGAVARCAAFGGDFAAGCVCSFVCAITTPASALPAPQS